MTILVAPPPVPTPPIGFLPPVFQILKTSDAVKAHVGSNPPRIYRHGIAMQDTLPAYISWFMVTGLPEHALGDTPPFDRCTVQIDCWNVSDAGIESLAMAVRTALEPYAYLTQVPINDFETETRLYRIALQFDFLFDRPQT